MQGQMDRTRRTAVYRLYNEAGELIYVGVGFIPEERMRAHAREKPWWPLVKSWTITWHPDRQSARDAETAAIKAEHPIANIAGTPLNDTKTHIAREAAQRAAAERRAAREQRIAQLNQAGKTVRQIARIAGVPPERVQKILRQLEQRAAMNETPNIAA